MGKYVFPFEKLEIWRLSIDLAEFILGLLETLPPNRFLRLTRQMEAAVVSPGPRVVHYVGGSSSNRIFRSMLDFHVSAYKLFCKYSNNWARLASSLVACALASRFVLALIINKLGKRSKK